MKTRKIISLCCVVALMLCMSANVVATTVNNNTEATTTTGSAGTDVDFNKTEAERTITVGSTLWLPVIKVVIKDPNTIIVNPYKMVWNGDSATDSLISTPTGIENHSDISVKVTATPKAAAVSNSDVVFAGSDTGIKDATEPTVFLEMKIANFTTVPADNTVFGTSGTAEKKVTVTKENTTSVSIDLVAASSGTPTYGAYTFNGASGGSGWDGGDLILIKIVFDISPIIPAT